MWENRAACRDHDPDDWWPDRRDRFWREAARRATRICNTCPVRPQCAAKALRNDERLGIWAGVLMMPHVTRRPKEIAELIKVAALPPGELREALTAGREAGRRRSA